MPLLHKEANAEPATLFLPLGFDIGLFFVEGSSQRCRIMNKCFIRCSPMYQSQTGSSSLPDPVKLIFQWWGSTRTNSGFSFSSHSPCNTSNQPMETKWKPKNGQEVHISRIALCAHMYHSTRVHSKNVKLTAS